MLYKFILKQTIINVYETSNEIKYAVHFQLAENERLKKSAQ